MEVEMRQTLIGRASYTLLSLGVIVWIASSATLASAQSDAWSSTDSKPVATKPQTGTQSAPFDESKIRGYQEFTGFYGEFGAAVGRIELDGRADVDTGGGFTMTGGYRFLPWLSGEGNVTYLGGGEIKHTNDDVDFFSITVGPKLYPMGFLDDQPIPEFVQPYALIGIGGGQYDGGSAFSEQGTFVARFIFGFDLWVTDHIGGFVEGGYHVASDSDVDGTGIFSIGAQYRF